MRMRLLFICYLPGLALGFFLNSAEFIYLSLFGKNYFYQGASNLAQTRH